MKSEITGCWGPSGWGLGCSVVQKWGDLSRVTSCPPRHDVSPLQLPCLAGYADRLPRRQEKPELSPRLAETGPQGYGLLFALGHCQD